jgi:hypothetical protein
MTPYFPEIERSYNNDKITLVFVLQKKSPKQIASTFAEEVSIVKMLREAISVERTLQKGQKIENMRLADLWFMARTEKRALKQCYVHYEFSR